MAAGKPVIITAPTLDFKQNIGGISSVAQFIISNNHSLDYLHFELGKHDNEKRSLLYFFRIIKAWLSWFNIVRKGNFAFIHFNIALEKKSILRDAPLIILTRLYRRKTIIHLHGGVYMSSEKVPRLIRFTNIKILSGDEPKIVLGESEKDKILSDYNAKNVFILPNSLDISEAIGYKRTYKNSSVIKILFIGRIVKDKGLDYILESLVQLNSRGVDFEFMMAGGGKDLKEYQTKFSELLGSRFIYQGIVSGNSKTQLFKQCDVYLLPSFYEGLPVSMLESMSFALVPIVTPVGSIPQIVRDGFNGIIVKKYSSKDIIETIVKLYKDIKLRKYLGENARKYILDNFNSEKYFSELNRIYRAALK